MWLWRVKHRIFSGTPRQVKRSLRIYSEFGWSFLETCINEDLHRVFPHKSEAEAEQMTAAVLSLLTPKDRKLLTNRYRRKLGI